ncbi:hypothetical protein B0H16DRAFT_1570855 [Mycena metata]|uniref:Uncharacterized protein n=1 Tax=Mycena metata TaxID=1033252 RepID=A0AAD7IB66_9AGAR|nr:hypothetical protein B0H16DRAFT_1570855 [Mycena metata]
MLSAKTFNLFFLAAIMGTVVARPANFSSALVARNSCDDHLGRCDLNGCDGAFPNGGVEGICQGAGKFLGCPCNRCGDNPGRCSANGCLGFDGGCSSGKFAGCPCK